MRTSAAVVACVVMVVLVAAQSSSAVPIVRFVSPAVAVNSNQRLECTVVNGDTSAHDATITFYDSTGAEVSSPYPQLVAAHGSFGVSFPPGGANHCEITAAGRAEWFRASIDVLDTTASVQPHVVVALPIW